jgi:nitrogen regulatory protein PII
MKAIFIAFDQAYYDRIVTLLEKSNCRGFTAWEQVQGRGTRTGEPHYGSHAWPSMASSVLTIVDDSRVDNLLAALNAMDLATPKLGLRAFVWPIEKTI